MSRAVLALALAASLGPRAGTATTGVQDGGALRVVRPEYPEHVLGLASREGPPPLRGWRAPIEARSGTGGTREEWPFDLPSGEQDDRDAATLVAKRLARDGLLATAVRAIEALGAAAVAGDAAPAARLLAVGLPADLLVHFELAGAAPDAGADARVRVLATRLAQGADVEALAAELASAPFAFRPTGFRAASESGERPLALVRLQLSRGGPWLGDDDGGNVDLARQLIERLDDVPFLLTVGEQHADELIGRLRGLADGRAAPVTLVVEPWDVAQWAQDNGEPGRNAAGEVATLVPRWASRGEGAAAFVPGETFLADGLARAGHAVVASPLLFQGGNLLCVDDPARDGERVLVAGEAEVWRNVALGLSPDEVRAALVAELGADRIVVLPAVSFHVDAEVTFRAVSTERGGELVAFVNDQDPALRAVLAAGVDVLEREGVAGAEDAARTRAAIEGGRWLDVVNGLGGWLAGRSLAQGVYPAGFAAHFSTGPTDPGPANLQILLEALDVVTSRAVPAEQIQDPYAAAYLRAIARDEAGRRALHAELAAEGWRVVPVPGLVAEERSLVYVNALHEEKRTLVPEYGGLYAALDRAAHEAFARALGPGVEVIGVRAAESQRRNGALHCSAALYSAR